MRVGRVNSEGLLKICVNNENQWIACPILQNILRKYQHERTRHFNRN